MVTARSESKAKDFAGKRSRYKELLEVVVTGDLTTVGAFDDLAKHVDVIIHCASVSHSLSFLRFTSRSRGESLSDPIPWFASATFGSLNAYPLFSLVTSSMRSHL